MDGHVTLLEGDFPSPIPSLPGTVDVLVSEALANIEEAGRQQELTKPPSFDAE